MNRIVNWTDKISVTVTPAKTVRFQTPPTRFCAIDDRENKIPLSRTDLEIKID